MRIWVSFVVKLLFCACCFVTLPAYAAHTFKQIKLVVNAPDGPKNLIITSCKSARNLGGLLWFDCRAVSVLEVRLV